MADEDQVHEGTVEFYRDEAGECRWRLKAANGEVVANSGEGFRDMTDAQRAFDTVERLVALGVVDRVVEDGA